jgi:dTDP-4-dehydrorhamnose reductase
MKKIIIFGSNGMLGKYVTEYLSQKGFNILPLTRKDFEVILFSEMELFEKLKQLNIDKEDTIINCIGLIKQRDDISKLDFLTVNSIFPQTLAKVCNKQDINLIHVTSDCAYDGLKGSYNEYDLHDAKDNYGLSKSLGESNECTTIRTSIIGEEDNNKLSLIEWVKSNKNKTVNGYMNHYWNGITCLQYAQICEEIITKDNYWKGIKHIHSNETVSKYELVNMISDIYDLNIIVNEFTTDVKCDRSLSSIYDDFNIPSLYEQILEQKRYREN